MVTDTKKLELIKQIAEIEDQALIDQLEHIITSNQTILAKMSSPIQKEFNLEKIKEEQHFQPTNKDELDRLIKEADIQEPIEDLLKMLKQ